MKDSENSGMCLNVSFRNFFPPFLYFACISTLLFLFLFFFFLFFYFLHSTLILFNNWALVSKSPAPLPSRFRPLALQSISLFCRNELVWRVWMFSSVFCEPMFTFFLKVNVNFFAFLSVKSPPFYKTYFYFLSINWRPSPDKSKSRLIKIFFLLYVLTYLHM